MEEMEEIILVREIVFKVELVKSGEKTLLEKR